MAVGTGRITVEEFDEWVELPENADKLFEYIGGEIVEVPSNPYVSSIALRIGRYVGGYVDDRDLGYVTGEAGGYMVSGERYAPDVAFLAKDKGPLADRGYNPAPPALAVEVLSSPGERDTIRLKLANYLAAGTLTWIVDPDTKTVEVYRPGQKALQVGIDGTLDGGDVLPGFTLAVSDIFPD
jgi:Uma2 family endonuclease